MSCSLFFQSGRLYRLAQVTEGIGLSRSTIYELINKGRFPKPVRLGKSSCWRGADLLAVVEHGEDWVQVLETEETA